jgi:hypothetical protein
MTISFKELFQYIYLLLLMLVLLSYAVDKEFFNKILTSFIASNAFLVSVCLASYFTGKMVIPSINLFSDGTIEIINNVYFSQSLVESSNVINRISGIMGLDTIAIANCILIQALFVNYKIRQTKGIIKLLLLILFAADAVTIVITYSRAALFIFFITNFITLLSNNHKKNLGLIILAGCSIPFVLSLFPTIYERILEAFNPGEGSTKYHFVFWIVALKEGYDHIVTGIGLGNAAYQQKMYVSLFSGLFSKFKLYNADAANIHNFILQIWAEQGLMGIFSNVLLIFSPIIYFIKTKIYRKINYKSVYDFIILAYIATLIYNLTNNNFYIETFWVMTALVYTCKSNYGPEADRKGSSILTGTSVIWR